VAKRNNLQLERRTAPEPVRQRSHERRTNRPKCQLMNERQPSMYQSDRHLREPQSHMHMLESPSDAARRTAFHPTGPSLPGVRGLWTVSGLHKPHRRRHVGWLAKCGESAHTMVYACGECGLGPIRCRGGCTEYAFAALSCAGRPRQVCLIQQLHKRALDLQTPSTWLLCDGRANSVCGPCMKGCVIAPSR
jgi:hypothetical protein